MFLTWLEISVASCTTVFAPQDAGVLEASEAMRGHHPESCPRRVLQLGELVVDTSRASGQRVRRVVQGLRAVKMGGAPLVLIFEMLKKAIGILLKSSLCGKACTPICFVLFCLSYNSRSCLSGRPLPLRDRSRCGASGLRLKKLVAALPLRPSRTANADGL